MPSRSASPTISIAVKDGYRRLGLSTEAVASFQFEVIAARRDFAANPCSGDHRLCQRARRRVPLHSRSGASRRRGQGHRRAHRRIGRYRPRDACALSRSRSRRAAASKPKSISAASPKSSLSWARAAPSSRRCRRRSSSSICNTFAPPERSDHSRALASSHSASISASVASCGFFPSAANACSIAAKRRSNFRLVPRSTASGSARR